MSFSIEPSRCAVLLCDSQISKYPLTAFLVVTPHAVATLQLHAGLCGAKPDTTHHISPPFRLAQSGTPGTHDTGTQPIACFKT